MRIFINERQEQMLIKMLIKESEGDQNLLVFKFLDDNFIRADYTQEVDGRPTKVNTVVWLDSDKQPFKTITLERLFYILQDEFQNLTNDKKERDERLKNILQSWVSKKYNKKTGNLLP